MNDRFLRACRREPVDMTPVWFMRQAGRYMASYRAIRDHHTLLDICRNPELAAQVTLQPVNEIEVDAAILFSDLLLPLEPMGIPFDFVKGEGPVIDPPVRTVARIDSLRRFEPRESLAHVLDTIRLLRTQHARLLRHRGGTVEQLRAYEGADVWGTGGLAPPGRYVRDHRGRLPDRTD